MSATLRQEVIDTARAMNASGLNQGRSGNVSVRCGDGFLITPSGRDYDDMTADQIVAMNFDGSWEGEGVRPSSEWRFHRDILQNRAELGAVVHAHPVNATALAVHGREIPPFHYMIAMAGGPTIRCAGYATFGTQELSDLVLEALTDRTACLMAHHGMIACGSDLGSALGLAIEVETLAAQYLMAMQLGDPPLLDEEEINRVLEKIRAGYGYGSGPEGSS